MRGVGMEADIQKNILSSRWDMSHACRYQNGKSLIMLVWSSLYHCAVLHLKGMALNHLVITQLQQMLRKQQHCRCPWSKYITICLHPSERDQSSSYKVLCWVVDPLWGRETREEKGGRGGSPNFLALTTRLQMLACLQSFLVHCATCWNVICTPCIRFEWSRRRLIRQAVLCVLKGAAFTCNKQCFLFDITIYW